MKTRLVVFRRNTVADDLDDVVQHEMDLGDSPNIQVNYNWLDIKEPDKRKSTFSQTIKIPFTNANNQFFENWFDANIDTAVFKTKKKFRAIIYVDTIPQLEGYIQLKSIYTNSRLYEVVVFGDTTNFFTDIKNKKLYDAFTILNESDLSGDVFNIDNQLDHLLTGPNIVDSWSDGLTTVNSVVDNDVMYPVIDYGHAQSPYSSAMFFSPDTMDDLVDSFGDTQQALDYYGMVKVGHLKPAIRIQRLLKIIAQKAGYTITSDFLGLAQDGTQSDTEWFSRIFMTLATDSALAQTTVFNGFEVYNTNTQTFTFDANCNQFDCFVAKPVYDTEVFDGNDLYDLANDVIVIPAVITPDIDPIITGLAVNWSATLTFPNANTVGYVMGDLVLDFFLCVENYNYWQLDMQTTTVYLGSDPAGSTTVTFNLTFSIDPANPIWPGDELAIYIAVNEGYGQFDWTIDNTTLETVNQNEFLFMNGLENQEIKMCHQMPDITQVDFVKDIVNRFNLIVLTNPDDANNLIIEPYNTYIQSGTTKYWTDKLDISKEQVVKSTNEIQSKTLNFSDLPGKDYLNASYQSKFEGAVWGAYTEFRDNAFTEREFKNFSVFAPFIAHGIPMFNGNTIMDGFAIHSAWKLNNDFDFGEAVTDGKPKLFYYNGEPLGVSNLNAPDGSPYNFKIWSGSNNEGLEYTDTGGYNGKFPLCIPFNLSSLSAGITPTTKELNWTHYTPDFENNLNGINLNPYGINSVNVQYTNHGYYNDYWSQYINEIYSDEARIMDCYLNLTPQDINEFDFASPVYIKNTLWRVLEIKGYVVGGNETTKVRLLKAIDKLNYDCAQVPSEFNEDGTIDFINSQTGVASNVTNECCEGLNPNWTFFMTNSANGTGDCYHNLDIDTGGVINDDTQWWSESQVSMALPNVSIPNLPMPSLVQGSSQTIGSLGYNGQVNQFTTIQLQAITVGTSTGYLNHRGLNPYIIRVMPNTMVTISLDLQGVVQTGTNIGEHAYRRIYTVVTNRFGTMSALGSAGGDIERDKSSTSFGSYTVNMNNYTTTSINSGVIKISVTHASASNDEQIEWNGNLTLQVTRMKIEGLIFERAVYQNEDLIMFENTDLLQWN